MTDEQEQTYLNGSRMAWLQMLQLCLKNLDVDDPEAQHVRWIQERELAVLTLREVCSEYGDNDWDNNLHLSDVIEKHLRRSLDDKFGNHDK